MFHLRDTEPARAIGASLGGVIVVIAAILLASYQSRPTIIDAALPLLALSIWVLALRTPARWREPLLVLIPVIFAIEVAVPRDDLRLLLLGVSVALAVAVHLAGAGREWEPFEMLTAAAILAPLRIVASGWTPVLIQTIVVAGAVALWRFLRRGGAPPATVAAAVLLLTVTIPSHSARASLIPWLVLLLVIALRRESWLMKGISIVVAGLFLKWMAAAVAVIVATNWMASRSIRPGSHAFLPLVQRTTSNAACAAAALPFFPSLYRSAMPGAVVFTSTALALLVRPSLTAPIVAVGIVAACSLWSAGGEEADQCGVLADLPALVLVGTILVFLPWSGAIIPRPPGPLPLLAVLLLAALALLPVSLRSWAGIAGAALFGAFLLTSHPAPPTDRILIDSYLAGGEQITIPVDPGAGELELRIAGANLGDAPPGYRVAKVEILGSDARGYARMITIGEIADWGAFRPGHVLETQNPRPDEPTAIEGYGVGAWPRGTGRVRIPSVDSPRWIVITAAPGLKKNENLIIEEMGFRR